jgi:hypothetical protein
MPLLARRVNGNLWAKATDEALWQGSEFPYYLLPELIEKGDGVSVWQLASESDTALDRILAAMLAGTASVPGKDIPSVEFRLVERTDVEALGISIKQTDGDVRDEGIKKLHYELSDLNASRAIALLRLMKKNAKVFTAKEAARVVAQSIVNKHLPPGVLGARDFLQALHKAGAVQIVVPT